MRQPLSVSLCFKTCRLSISNWRPIILARSSTQHQARTPMSITASISREAPLPDRFRDVDHLEDVMTAPSGALIADMARIPGDIIVLGVGGKIGPTLARLAKRAAPGKRVVGVARFSEKGLRERLTAWGIECIEADLLDRAQIAALPKLPNVVFMAGRKFGSAGAEDLTWAMNSHVPDRKSTRLNSSHRT